MDGIESLNLDDNEYTLTPVNEGLSRMMELAKSATTGGIEEHHLHDVVNSDGTRVMAVKWDVDRTKEGGGLIKSGSVDISFIFETPDSERLLTLEYDPDSGWFQGPKYLLRDASTGSVLGTWKSTSLLTSKWTLEDSGGKTVAVTGKPWQRTLRELVPFTQTNVFHVTAPGGFEIARIQLVNSGLTSLQGPEVTVSLRETRIPGEILIAIAAGLRREATKGSSDGNGGGE